MELLTFHRAKGLEFDTVFVTGLERGLVPISYAKTPEALDEEQRLLYVALSRAERTLQLSWAQQRTVGMRTANRTPSPWLARVERAAAGGAPDESPVNRSRALASPTPATGSGERRVQASAPRRLICPRPRSRSTRRWWPGGSTFHRAANSPAYVIFPNATLLAIATARPRSAAALLSVPGIGAVKAERYGDAVLALVTQHSEVAAT